MDGTRSMLDARAFGWLVVGNQYSKTFEVHSLTGSELEVVSVQFDQGLDQPMTYDAIKTRLGRFCPILTLSPAFDDFQQKWP